MTKLVSDGFSYSQNNYLYPQIYHPEAGDTCHENRSSVRQIRTVCPLKAPIALAVLSLSAPTSAQKKYKSRGTYPVQSVFIFTSTQTGELRLKPPPRRSTAGANSRYLPSPWSLTPTAGCRFHTFWPLYPSLFRSLTTLEGN